MICRVYDKMCMRQNVYATKCVLRQNVYEGQNVYDIVNGDKMCTASKCGWGHCVGVCLCVLCMNESVHKCVCVLILGLTSLVRLGLG